MAQDLYKCAKCGRTYPADARVWACKCGHYLDVQQHDPFDKDDVDSLEPSLWRYRKALHLDGSPSIYFREGRTPLLERTWDGLDLHFKVDFLMPSGSFKDRGSALMMNRLAELGVDDVVEDSSGNGGASIAAYAAAAGMRCRIFVPATTSEGKRAQVRAYGGTIVAVPGSRDDTAQAAQDAARDTTRASFYASHNWYPLFPEGVKTVAFELWEDFDYHAPAAVLVPTSYGSNLLGLYRGFSQLLAAGAIDKMPQLFACQAANCAPLHALHTTGSADITPQPTIAEGIAGRNPLRKSEMLAALTNSAGGTVAVPEDDIAEAVMSFACSSGLFIEPTCAVALVAAKQLAAAGRLPDGPIAVILTGNGLKTVSTMMPFLMSDDATSAQVSIAQASNEIADA
ncbi:MAG: pyridoxal-phosphate dependent enzyme [Deinococcota bacterium]